MNKTQIEKFKVKLTPPEKGSKWWVAELPAIEIVSQGTSKRSALRNLSEAVQGVLLSNWEEQFDIQPIKRKNEIMSNKKCYIKYRITDVSHDDVKPFVLIRMKTKEEMFKEINKEIADYGETFDVNSLPTKIETIRFTSFDECDYTGFVIWWDDVKNFTSKIQAPERSERSLYVNSVEIKLVEED